MIRITLATILVSVVTVNPAFGQSYSKTPYCQYCDDDRLCESNGACCLTRKEDFKKNTPIESFYCADRRLLTYNETKFRHSLNSSLWGNVWMISKCNQMSANETIKESCENTNMNTNLELVVPVSDSVSNYRNKFCAYCNGVNASQIINWRVELYCDADLLTSRHNIISTIKRRKCNLFFAEEENIPVQLCQKTTRVQKSSGCVTTVQGPKLSGLGGSRCGFVKHPLKSTSVCHFCNTIGHLEQVNEICIVAKGDVVILTQPPYFAILDLGAINKRRLDKSQEGCDPSTQFDDEIYNVCREVLCNKLRYLRNKTCLPSMTEEKWYINRYMFSIFITFTPVSDDSSVCLIDNSVDLDTFQNNLQKIVTDRIPEEKMQDFRMYKTTIRVYTDEHNITCIAYFLVQIVLDFSILLDASDVISSFVVKVHNTNYSLLPSISFRANFVYCMASLSKFFCNIYPPTAINETETYLEQVAIIKNNIQGHLGFESFKKLNICPFVHINISEFPVTVDRDILYFQEKSSHFVFTKWEFEQSGDTISLCIDDFQTLYDALSNQQVILPNVFCLCTCLSVAFLLIP